MPIRGLIPGMALHFAGCCHPLPGDRIVGIVTTGKGVTIHTIDCDTLGSFADEPERWLDVAWSSDEADAGHVGRINVTIANEPGNLGSLTTTIGKQGGNISNLKITNRSTDFFEIMVDIEVADVKHLIDDHRGIARDPGHQLGRARPRLGRKGGMHCPSPRSRMRSRPSEPGISAPIDRPSRGRPGQPEEGVMRRR